MAFSTDEQQKRIADLHAKQEEDVVRQIADDLTLPYIDLTGAPIMTDALRLIKEDEARAVHVAGFHIIGKALTLAVQSPRAPGLEPILERLKTEGYTTSLVLVSMRSLQKAWDRYRDIEAAERTHGGLLDISDEALQKFAESLKSNGDIKAEFDKIIAERDTRQITKLMELVFGGAIATGTSDVHFEGQEKEARMRFRQDGVLQDIAYFPHDVYDRLLSRIKLLSEMKLTATETAQDGRFSIKFRGTEIEVRVSTVPGPYGEGIVMRILNPDSIALSFEALGIEPHLYSILQKEIAKPNGLILTTGPTGSGKTTTLYAFLKHLYTPEVKVMTIEDPIEYHLTGVNQTQVEHEKGYDFLAGLRAALRQDPDIIMVGEIRDKETATIAVNAALTGHLVLSTLHTNNAAGTIPRLLDLGVQPGILAAALTTSIAQRLIRRLCPHCKKQVKPSDEDDQLLRRIILHAEQTGKPMKGTGVTSDGVFALFEGVGCPECNNTGYKGRVGIYEAILTDDAIATLMTKQPTERDIKRAADKQGLFSMAEDVAIKIVTGITSLSEARSVIDLTEDDSLRTESASVQGVPVSELGTIKGKNDTIDTAEPILARPTQNNSWQTHELTLLVDYVKLLEAQQAAHPSTGIAHKIEEAKNTIIELLKSLDPSMLTAPSDPRLQVASEITRVRDALADLEEAQHQEPSGSALQNLRSIRATLEQLAQG